MDSKINLRIDEAVKCQLEELATLYDMSLSVYLRDLLTDHVSEDSCEGDYLDLPRTVYIGPTKEILKKGGYEQSFEFTQLLTWLFSKYMEPVETSSLDAINNLKNKVERVVLESSFSQELKLEFLKVLNDTNRFLVEPSYENKHFVFSTPNNQLSFNYYMLMNEIWNLKS
ncbi:hypothetical protein JCM19274_2674 [Algibacter lectus]|uniref:Uncharacterized protein n=1 Tax=Algibacter lectus TaxID=221126 RepID=A0A090X5R7_9FLAO|nr:hypothetical protein [Algibacter lectus]GAL80002.1 hypothetical protein JCM19274_2674 [Algibacter lectus]